MHRLAGGALDQVVLHHQNHHQAGTLRPVQRQAQHVGTARRAGFRMRAERHHVDKHIVLVLLLEQRLQRGVVDVFCQARVQRCMHAADHRHQVRRKHQANFLVGVALQLGQGLRRVAVTGDAIGLEIIARLGKQRADLGLATGARHTRLGVGDQAASIDQAGLQQRIEAQLHRRRIATRIGHQRGRFDRLAVQFRQAIYRLLEQFRRGMRDLVPLLEAGLIFQAEVGRQVDHLDAGRQQLWRLRHGDTVGGGEEHHIALRQVDLVGRRKRQLDVAAQRRVHVRHRQAVFLTRRNGRQLRLGMG